MYPFNFSSKLLLDWVGKRMLAYARLASYGITPEDINLLDSAFTSLDGEFTGPTTYSGEWWDKVRERASIWDHRWVKAVIEKDAYDMSDLRKDLNELKVYCRKYAEMQ
jgi:hypothetical protein